MPVQYGHLPGRVDLGVTAHGSMLITGGKDGLIRSVDLTSKWYLDGDENAPDSVEISELADFHTSAITALAVSPDGSVLATADEESCALRLFALKGPEETADIIALATRFGGPIRSISFSPTGSTLVCAGDEPGVLKMIHRANLKDIMVLREDDVEQRPESIVSLAYDPRGDFVLSIGNRGTMTLWSIDEKRKVVSKSVSELGASALSGCFSEDGERIMVGLGNGKALVLEGRISRWMTERKVLDIDRNDGTAPVTSVCFSPTGVYGITGDAEGQVVLWKISNTQLIDKWKSDGPISKLVWIPGQNAFGMADENGQWAAVGSVVPGHMEPPAKDVSTNAPRNVKTGESSDDENADVPIKRPKRCAVDDIDIDEESNDGSRQLAHLKTRGFLRRRYSMGAESDDVSSLEEDAERNARKKRRQTDPHAARFPTQEAFMPSSTPCENSATKRILQWSLAGVILCFKETVKSSIEIEFSDGDRRPVRFSDHYGFTQGCFSELGAFFGCPATESHPSSVFYRPFASWSSSSEWSLALDPGETSVLVALGRKFAVTITSKGYARLFSITGIQTEIFRISGLPLTATAAGNQLCIVTTLSGGTVWFELLEISEFGDTEAHVASGPLPLSVESTLEWVGFSDDGELVIYDSSDTLCSLRATSSGLRWCVVADNLAHAVDADTFWVVSVANESVFGIPCHGIEKHPTAVPRPALVTRPLEFPALEKSISSRRTLSARRTWVSRSRELQVSIATHGPTHDSVSEAREELQEAEILLDKALLKLFEEACRSDCAMRALDIASRLQLDKSSEIAFRVADHYKLTNLTQRLEMVLVSRRERRRVRELGQRQDNKRILDRPPEPDREDQSKEPETNLDPRKRRNDENPLTGLDAVTAPTGSKEASELTSSPLKLAKVTPATTEAGNNQTGQSDPTSAAKNSLFKAREGKRVAAPSNPFARKA